MRDNVRVAYEASAKAANEIYRSCIVAVDEQLKGADSDDNETLYDAIHEAADSACTYVSDCYVLAWGLPDSEMENDTGLPNNVANDVITQLAYCRLHEMLSNHFADRANI